MRRSSKIAKVFGLVLLSTLALSWVFLCVSSLYERRKADRLIADLKKFPFATANFTEVRDFAMQHGGVLAEGPPSQTPPFTCTVQNCTFEIWLGRPFSQPPTNQWLWQSLYPTLPYIGLRPWGVHVSLDVRGGVLDRSRTDIGQLKRGTLRDYAGLLTIEYSILTEKPKTSFSFGQLSSAIARSDDYAVFSVHVTGPPTEAWETWILQTPDAPIGRAFDTNLSCLTTILHGCAGLNSLAPSAWQHYQATLKTP